MIFRLVSPFTQLWHRWFAWYPVEVVDDEGRWAWLEPVWRRNVSSAPLEAVCWTYRLGRPTPSPTTTSTE